MFRISAATFADPSVANTVVFRRVNWLMDETYISRFCRPESEVKFSSMCMMSRKACFDG